ncbi:hypothetical protein AAG570_003544 [Ranatra chinensis]|uniref:Uncharacterized protein n=1 Tax=Ranatra chinensis TaxID=642074 RepID=A0ABD0Y571_9HEMI
MASKRRNMFQKNKTQETTENANNKLYHKRMANEFQVWSEGFKFFVKDLGYGGTDCRYEVCGLKRTGVDAFKSHDTQAEKRFASGHSQLVGCFLITHQGVPAVPGFSHNHDCICSLLRLDRVEKVTNLAKFSREITTYCNLDKLRAMFNVNVIAPALCAREYFKWIKTANSNGHIININSIAGVKTLPNKGLHSYSASKQAAKCISEGMRFEILQTKLPIKITDLYPGCGATELFGEEEMKELIGVIGDPTAFLKPQEIADAVVHVLSTDPEVRISNMMIQHSREIFM